MFPCICLFPTQRCSCLLSNTREPNTVMRTSLLLLLLILSFFNPLPSTSAEVGGGEYLPKWRRMGLGSRPPACVNRCLSCRPCMATLVVSHEINLSRHGDDDGGDDGYYLVSWKCACGNKLFKP